MDDLRTLSTQPYFYWQLYIHTQPFSKLDGIISSSLKQRLWFCSNTDAMKLTPVLFFCVFCLFNKGLACFNKGLSFLVSTDSCFNQGLTCFSKGLCFPVSTDHTVQIKENTMVIHVQRDMSL